MKPLHIAFFNRAFHPEVSATGLLLTELAEGLCGEHGCRVTVVCGIPQGPSHGAWKSPRGLSVVCRDSLGEVSILRARGTRFTKGILAGRTANYLTYFASSCVAGLRLDRPDVVVALTDPPIIGLAALLAARRFRCPLVISFRDLFPEVARLLDKPPHPIIEEALNRVNRILIRRADRLVALGEAMRERLVREKGAPPEKVRIIPDWADTSLIRPGPKENPFSKAHGLTDRFVVMHSGNMGVSQNLDVLLQAARKLSDLPSCLFVLIGDGVKKPMLQEQAARMGLENVLFLPYQPKETLSEAFASADCFVVSLKPGLAGYITPSKLYGILAAGRPYIASVDPECDVARISERYRCGLPVKAGDPEAMVEAVRLLYKDRELKIKLGENGRAAASDFERAKGVRAYFELFRGLARKGVVN